MFQITRRLHSASFYHIPVLEKEVIQYICTPTSRLANDALLFVDGTTGGGNLMIFLPLP